MCELCEGTKYPHVYIEAVKVGGHRITERLGFYSAMRVYETLAEFRDGVFVITTDCYGLAEGDALADFVGAEGGTMQKSHGAFLFLVLGAWCVTPIAYLYKN